MRKVSFEAARRLAVSRQHLDAPSRPASKEGILALIRELGCLQLDPTSVVSRSERLVLWSRLGHYDPGLLEELRWKDRALFDYWAHAASIVPTSDWALHAPMMRAYGNGSSAWSRETRAWIEKNHELRDHVLGEIRERGPVATAHFEDRTVRRWDSSGWNDGRNVGRMLEFLWLQGRLVIGGRQGQNRLWELAERWMPAAASSAELTPEEVTRQAAERALRALGVARKIEIERHFLRSRYQGLAGVLAELEKQGRVLRAEVEGVAGKGPWFLHVEDLPQLERIEAGAWEGRTTLLSPFDNLICDRDRTERLFGFEFRIEIYVPKNKRRWGYYVLPLLHGERLIGRLDLAFDRGEGCLHVHAVHAEREAPKGKGVAGSVRQAVESLARWLGARRVRYHAVEAPAAWKQALIDSEVG